MSGGITNGRGVLAALALAVLAGTAGAKVKIVTDTKLPLPAIVYSGVLVKSQSGEPIEGPTTKDMRFAVYSDWGGANALWQTNFAGVAVSTAGTFQVTLSDEKLGWLLATGSVTHVGFSINKASEILPRRELLPIALASRVHTADEAAADMSVGVALAGGTVASEWLQAGRLTATGTLNAVTKAGLTVRPFAVGAGEMTTLMRGAGFTRGGGAPTVKATTSGAYTARGAALWTADGDGIAVIHCSSYGSGRSELRVPAVSQFCRKGDVVRCPTAVAGQVSVTFYPFKR